MFFELGLEIEDARLSRVKLRAAGGEFLQQHVHLLPRIGERAFAHAGGQIPFLFPQLDGMNSLIGVTAQLF